MTGPFDRDDLNYHVLVNDEGQRSLWPAFADPPTGWSSEFGEADRESCAAYIETHWTDMRPRSVSA